MSIQTIADLKALWIAGYAPTQEDFANLFDTLVPFDPATGQILTADGTQLTGVVHTESDPVVGSVAGLVKADGAGTIGVATPGTDYLAPDGDGSGLSGVLKDASAFATAAQGALADTALQVTNPSASQTVTFGFAPADTAPGLTVKINNYGPDANALEISAYGQQLLVYGAAALTDPSAFATAAQGATADSALQPNATANGTYLVSNDGVTSGQLASITIANGLITAVTVLP